MPRHFGLRAREEFNRFWNEPENERDPTWPFWVIGAAVLLIVGIGVFIA